MTVHVLQRWNYRHTDDVGVYLNRTEEQMKELVEFLNKRDNPEECVFGWTYSFYEIEQLDEINNEYISKPRY